eukprot:CAMPEP_0177428600 /NCGR_PEP_ID=MMETSP0368-20130122/74671_1 /TAXON_ID=447022 ORGANISM="Scrippsiella hangoei-like, Strain SHHI-4" /NCGR_SAMPLE_ID=MMETSP0368 /ASSEMBLY_ACC=CAM_ASM_000363 /LENGTH=42 /DNA_ID= /DNA_START= /DNA_END= /DNA_ORIENTATION=
MTRGPYADTGILDAILARVPKQGSERQLRGSGHEALEGRSTA